MNEDKPLYNLEEEDESPENDDCLYSVEETERQQSGLSADEEDLPLAYGQWDIEDDDVQKRKRKTTSSYTLLLRVMFGPAVGWKELKRSRLTPDRMATRCFLPMTLLVALSGLVSMFYTVGTGMLEHIIRFVITFVSFFFGYFLLPVMARPFMEEKGRAALASPFGRNAMMICFVTLEMFDMLENIFPGFEPVIVFLPLWTIYLIHRLVPVMKIPQDRQAMSTIVLSALTIGLPALWNYLLTLVMP